MTDKNKELTWDDFGKTDLLPEGHSLGDVSLMFEKIEDDAIEAQIKKLQDAKTANEVAEQAGDDVPKVKENVAFEDFEKLDIRVATVLECEKVCRKPTNCCASSSMTEWAGVPSFRVSPNITLIRRR